MSRAGQKSGQSLQSTSSLKHRLKLLAWYFLRSYSQSACSSAGPTASSCLARIEVVVTRMGINLSSIKVGCFDCGAPVRDSKTGETPEKSSTYSLTLE
jgi:hypothetical protein